MLTTEVGVLDKVMSLLALFDDRTPTLDPVTAARRAGMTTPTAYRLMKAMTAHGLLAHDGSGYRLGLTLLHLGQLAGLHFDIVRIAQPFMVRLRDECNESVELQVRADNPRAIALYRSHGFEHEGTRRALVRADDGRLVDDLVMGLLFTQPDAP